MRLGAADAAAGVEQVQRRLLADGRRERHAEREALVDADQREVRREPRLGRGHPEVGGHGQAQAAADRGALDRGDDRQRLLEQADREVIQVRSVRRRRSRARR